LSGIPILLIDPAGIHVDYFVFNDAVGQSISVSAVPVPAAAWLLGSALGMLGVLRRRTPHAPLPALRITSGIEIVYK
jgi:hypothetical protein